jgi:hypothetical protein
MFSRLGGVAGGHEARSNKDGVVTASGPNPKQDDYRLISMIKLPRLTGLKLEVLPQNGVLSRGKSASSSSPTSRCRCAARGSSQIRDIAVKSAVSDTKVEGKAREYGDVKGTLDDDPRNGWTTKGFPQRSASHRALRPRRAAGARKR